MNTRHRYYRVRIQWMGSSKTWKVSFCIVEGIGSLPTEEREISSASAEDLEEALQEPCKYLGWGPQILLAAAEDGVAISTFCEVSRSVTVTRPILLAPGD